MSLSNPPAVGDIVKLTVVCACEEQIGLNVRYWKVLANTLAGVTMAEIANKFDVDLASKYRELMSEDAQYRGVIVQNVYPTPVGAAFNNVDGVGVGLEAFDVLPKQVCGIITLTSARAGRSGRGRIYVPFPAESSNTESSKPNAGYVTDLATLGLYMSSNVTVTDVNGNSTELQPGLPRLGNFATWEPITGYLARDKWATQRRRGDYGKHNVPPI